MSSASPLSRPQQPHDAILAEAHRPGRWRPGKDASASGGSPCLVQRLPANQRAPQREECLVDVRSLVISHAQAAKLTEPGKRTLHDPPPPAQATPMLGAAHGQQGHNVTSAETAPNGGRVVAAIPDHTVWPLPRSPAFAVQRGIASSNAKASCESFRFAPVRRTARGTPRPSQIR